MPGKNIRAWRRTGTRTRIARMKINEEDKNEDKKTMDNNNNDNNKGGNEDDICVC